jgi:ribosome biogenesis GTPase
MAAIENEELDEDSYINFIKMRKEQMHFDTDAKERRKKDKDFGKMIKTIQKQRRNNKY